MKDKSNTKKRKTSAISSEYAEQSVEIKPLKDHEIHHNEHHIFLKEGEPVPVPRKFLSNLVTEGVIKSIPKEG